MTKLTRSLAQEGWQEQPDSQEALGTQDDEDDEGGLPGGVPNTRNSDLRRGVEDVEDVEAGLLGGVQGGLPGGVHDIAMPCNPCRTRKPQQCPKMRSAKALAPGKKRALQEATQLTAKPCAKITHLF